MKIQYNRGTLHLLPPRSAGWWEWCDVVDRSGDGDGVEPTAAHACRKLLEYDRDAEKWRTTRRLEDYLQDQWGIELEGDAGLKQSKLPTVADGGTAVESSPRTIGADIPDTPTRSEPELVQVDLHGRDAGEKVDELASEAHVGHNVQSGEHGRASHVKAAQDVRQATIAAFTSSLWVGRLARPCGDAYDDRFIENMARVRSNVRWSVMTKSSATNTEE